MHLVVFKLTCNSIVILLLLLDGAEGIVLILALLVLVDRLGDVVLVPQLLPLHVPLVVLLLVLDPPLLLRLLDRLLSGEKKLAQ